MADYYIDNILRERWDDDARVYTAWDAGGAQTVQRPYTAAENARADADAANALDAANRAQLLQQLHDGVVNIQAARDAASGDITTADGLRTAAANLKAAATSQKTAIAAFVPGTTYKQSDITAIRDALVTLIGREESQLQAFVDGFTYRIAVDQNAITTDDALLWLARYVSGRITG